MLDGRKPVCAQKTIGYFLRSAGFKRTLSGETFFRPENASTFLSNTTSARSKGVLPFKLSLAVELMCWASKVTFSCVRVCMVLPFGIT